MPTDMGGSEHQWPSELDADARCEKCGLPYAQWDTEETYWCHQ